MSHRSFARSATRKGTALALLASAALYAGSPLVATSSASSGGYQRSVSAGFGDCKNANAGEHLGYVCPDPGSGAVTPPITGSSTDSVTDSSTPSVTGSSTDSTTGSSTDSTTGSSTNSTTGSGTALGTVVGGLLV